MKVFLHSPFTMVRPRTTVLPLFTTMLGQTHREVIASTKFSCLACKWSRDQELHHNISKNRFSFSSAKCKKLSRSTCNKKLNWNGLRCTQVTIWNHDKGKLILMLQVRKVISLVTSHPYLPFCRHIIPILNFILIEIFLGVILLLIKLYPCNNVVLGNQN